MPAACATGICFFIVSALLIDFAVCVQRFWYYTCQRPAPQANSAAAASFLLNSLAAVRLEPVKFSGKISVARLSS
jgi:hypothetical protein